MMNNVKATAMSIDEVLAQATVEPQGIDADINGAEVDLNMWKGMKDVRLLDIFGDEYGYHLVFEDRSGNPMPSFFESEPVGSIWGGKTAQGLVNTLRSFKYALRLKASSSNPVEIKNELMNEYHEIYFIIEPYLTANGVIYRNKIDFKQTKI